MIAVQQKSPNEDTRVVQKRIHARYSNFRLPLATNIVVLVICLAAILGASRFYENRRIELASHESRFVTAEWQLLAQLKVETDRQLQAKDRQIAALRSRLLALPREPALSEQELAQRSRLQAAIESAYFERQELLSRRLAASRPPDLVASIREAPPRSSYRGIVQGAGSAGVGGAFEAAPVGRGAPGFAEGDEQEPPPRLSPEEEAERLSAAREEARAAGFADGTRAGREEALRDVSLLVSRLRGRGTEERGAVSTLLDADPLYFDVAREMNELAAAEVPEDRLYFTPPRLLGLVVRVNLGRAEIELAGDGAVSVGQEVEFRRRADDGRLSPLCTSEIGARYGNRVLVETCAGGEIAPGDVVYSRSRRIE